MRSVPAAYEDWARVLEDEVLRPFIIEKCNDEGGIPDCSTLASARSSRPGCRTDLVPDGEGDPLAGDTRNEITGGFFFSAVIQGRDVTVQLPPEVKPALAGLRAGSSSFTGRETDLRDALDTLVPKPDETPDQGTGGRRVRLVAVAGMAGVGKTELAVQAAHAVRRNGWFPGGVLFIDLFGYDCARRLEPFQALDGLLRALGIPAEHIPVLEQDRARLYAPRCWLPTRRRVVQSWW